MKNTAVNVRRYLIISSILALAAGAAGCGGSSDGSRPGAGGTTPPPTGTGGVVASGGTLGGGGAPGSGGTTAAPSANCTPGYSPPATSPLITDFATNGPVGWNSGLGKWGAIGTLWGGFFTYAGTTSSSVSWAVTNQALVLSGSVAPGDYIGGGMSFDQCVNTSVFTGVQFTLGGTVAGCGLKFQVQTFDEKPAGTNQVGGCPANCYSFPGEYLTTTIGPVTVNFSDLTGGQLLTQSAIANEIVGLQWQFESPGTDGGQLACPNIGLTITNVSFVQ